MIFYDDEPEIHPHALKHLNEEEVLEAWYSIVESVPRSLKDSPMRWLSIGFCTIGAVELISVELKDKFLIIHANELQDKFKKEVDKIKRRQK